MHPELGRGRGGHRILAEKWDRHTGVELLIHEKGKDATLADRANGLARAGGTLPDLVQARCAAQAPNQPVRNAIVGAAIDDAHLDSTRDREGGEQLPIGEMGTEENHRPAVVQVFPKARKVDELDTAAVDDPVEVRVLAHDPAEVVPHPSNNPLSRGGVEVRQRPDQIPVGAPTGAQPRADRAADEPAEGRCHVNGQHARDGDQQPEQRSLQRMRDAVAPKPETAVLEAICRHVFFSRIREEIPRFHAGTEELSSSRQRPPRRQPSHRNRSAQDRKRTDRSWGSSG
ncbi:hypothetical protein M2351_003757 [Azospirillum canadense]|nr:hypothetical protein [Azospirillum canadense]MCW2239127.1 hypothetical protein [Azospirillum canadense]